MMKYSRTETLNLSNQIKQDLCLEYLNKLISDEGCSSPIPVFVNNELVINMDCVEADLANASGRLRNKSMDSAFVILDNAGTNLEILLVEFRFNYANLKNLNRNEMLGKVLGSTSALLPISNIHGNYIFVFETNLKNQAISRLNRMNPQIPTHYIAMDISDLKSIYF